MLLTMPRARTWVGVSVQGARLQQLDEVAVEQRVAKRVHILRGRLSEALALHTHPYAHTHPNPLWLAVELLD